MSQITTSLQTPFELTKENARERDSLQKRIDSHNAEDSAISTAETELKSTPTDQWTAGHNRSAALLRDRKLVHLHSDLNIRESIAAMHAKIENGDYQTARSAAFQAVEDAKRKATDHLVKGGWVATKSENGPLPIDYATLIRNADVCAAVLKLNSLESWSLHDARMANAKAMDGVREKFSNAKEKALAV